MIANVVQRWRDRRGSYRPAGETIRTRDYEVALIAEDAPARVFVCSHHYDRTYPAARFPFGLYRGGTLAGVAVFSHPVNERTLSLFAGARLESTVLGRFVLLDDVPGNGETWFLARCFELLRNAGIIGVVSFSDPVPRATAAGGIIFRGHLGTIYQAHNATFLGRAHADTMRLLPDGTVLHNRALTKIRHRERGWRYSAAVLERHGAAPLMDSEDSRAWLDRWLPRLTRKVRHQGNLKYAWGLTAPVRRRLPPSLPYPKFDARAA